MLAPDFNLKHFIADGFIDLPLSIGTRYGCSVQGDFGGGTFTFNHLNNGVPIPYELGTWTEDGGCWIFVMDTSTRFDLTGATDPDLWLRVIQLKV